MGFFDRVGDMYEKTANIVLPGWQEAPSKIGTAYSAASNSFFGDAVGKVYDDAVAPVTDILGKPLDLVKRGISTGGQVAQRENGKPSDVFDTDMWRKAWNRSEDISAGQVLDIGISNDLSHIPGVEDDRPDFFSRDPYSDQSRKAREDYFHNDWAGKLNSGGIDLILDFTADPLAGLGTIVKGARLANTTIKGVDRADALAASVGKVTPEITPSAAKSGAKLKGLYQRTDGLSASEIAAMPEFKKSGDAGAIAYFMEFANNQFADEATRHSFKADIMGSVLGDNASIERVKAFQTDIDSQIKAAGLAPKTMSYLSKYSRGDYGAAMISAAQADEAGTMAKLAAEREADWNRLQRVITVRGSSNKIASTFGERVGAAVTNDKVDGRLTEYIKPNGLFGTPVRYVIGQANQRVPGYVDIKDPTKGYQDLLNTLGQMKHTDKATKRDLADRFVRASSPDERRIVVEDAESTMFRDYGNKYKVSQDAVEKFMQEARGRRSAYQQGLKDRLYSAADPGKIVQFYDPEEDVTHVFDKAFLGTHFDSHHELTVPKDLDEVLSKGTNRRVLERFARQAKKGAPEGPNAGTTAANLVDASTQSTEWLLQHGTRLWKDAALFRLAYPARIQMDTQARTLVHLGMMQYIMTRKQVFGGQVKYLLEDSEGQKSLKNIFKEGDIDAALAKQLKPSAKDIARGTDTYQGHDLFPAKTDEDVQRIRAGIESTGGGAADVGNDIASADLMKIRGIGSWKKIKAGTPEWFDNWKRAADQIRTSPTGRKALELDDVDQLREWVNQTPAAREEWNAVKGSFRSQDEWLSNTINHANQYLPTPELKAHIANPEKAKDLFDLRSAEERLASIQGLKTVKNTKVQSVKDIAAELKDMNQRYDALPARSAERRALNIERKQKRAELKQARNDRWHAKAELGDAKNPPGRVDPQWEAQRQEFANSGETLYHGTTSQFDKFTDPGPYKNRWGRESSTQPKAYFSDKENIATQFADKAWRYVTTDGSLPENYFDLTKSERLAETKKVVAALRKQAKDHKLRIQRQSEDTGDFVDISPSEIKPSDVEDDTLRIGRKDVAGRVIKAKVYGKTLDLRKWEDIPDDIKQSLFNGDREGWREWGSFYKHEHDPQLLDLARAGGYGKIRVADSTESGGHSVIAVPEYIGHNRDVVGEKFGKPKVTPVNPNGLVEPMDVHGENYSPLKPNALGAYRDAVMNRWYKVIGDVPETIMGRAPIYVDTYKQYMKDAIDRLGEDGINAGGIDDIRKAADRRARQEVAEILFDTTHSSNAAQSMRLLAPFFSAWEDTMKKWGKLMYDNPTVPLTANKLWGFPQNAGLVHDSNGSYHQDGKYYDASGNEIKKEDYGQFGEYIVLPKLWGRNSKDPNQGSSFKLNRNALNVLFQGDPPWLPGLGPLVQIPTNTIVRNSFPEHANNPVLKYVLPFGVTDDSVPYQLLPTWVKQVRDSGIVPWLHDSKDFSQTYAMLFAQENTLYNTGQRKSKPTPEEVEGRTRNWYLMRAGLANGSPISIQPTPKLQFYIDQAHLYRSKYGEKWQEKFYDDFPAYYDMTLSLSHNETGIQATDKAYDATQKHRKQIRENPQLGWFFVGPDNLSGAFDPNINTWQRSTEAGQGKNFRDSKNPDAAIKEVQEQKGWIQYNKISTAINLALEARGLHSLNQKGAEDLAGVMQTFRETLAGSNSAWWEAYNQRDTSKIQTAYTAAQTAWKKDKTLAARPDQVAFNNYFRVREAVRGLLQSRETKDIDNPANADVSAAWNGYLTAMRQSPGFEQIWNRLLQVDDLSQEIL